MCIYRTIVRKYGRKVSKMVIIEIRTLWFFTDYNETLPWYFWWYHISRIPQFIHGKSLLLLLILPPVFLASNITYFCFGISLPRVSSMLLYSGSIWKLLKVVWLRTTWSQLCFNNIFLTIAHNMNSKKKF